MLQLPLLYMNQLPICIEVDIIMYYALSRISLPTKINRNIEIETEIPKIG